MTERVVRPNGSGRTSRLRGPAGKIVLLLCSTLLSLLLLELTVREVLELRSYDDWRAASLRYEYDPNYHWSLRPGRYGWKDFNLIVISKDGLREPSPDQPRNPGTLRVLCLGGSTTFNYHATAGQSWSRRLGNYLTKQLRRPVETINAGTPGYSSYQSSMRYERQLAAWKPDLVVVYHLWNDLKYFSNGDRRAILAKWNLYGEENAGVSWLDPFPFLDGLTARSQALTHARLNLVELRRQYWREHRHVDEEGWTFDRLDRKIEPEAVRFFRENYERIISVSDSLGIPTVLVDQVMLLRPDTPKKLRPKIRYDYLGFHHDRAIEAVNRARSVFDSLAVSPSVHRVQTDQIPVDQRFLRDHVHLTDRGLAKLAVVIGKSVVHLLRPLGSGGG